MDPDVCWHAVKEGSREAAENLTEWLLRGGFPPKGKTRDEILLFIRITFGIVPAGEEL